MAKRVMTSALCIMLAVLLSAGWMPSSLASAVQLGQARVAYADAADDDDEAARQAEEEERIRQEEEERLRQEEEQRQREEEERLRQEEEERIRQEEEQERIRQEEEQRQREEEERQRQEQEQQEQQAQQGQQSGESQDPSSGSSDVDPVRALYLFYENYENPQKALPYSPKAKPLISDAKGTMQLYAQCELSDGTIDWAQSAGVRTVWSIVEMLDEDGAPASAAFAEIDRGNGVLRALGQGNGRVTVRCQVQNASAYADMVVTIKGNSGVPYITDIQICDENGSPYGNDAEVRVESKDFGVGKDFHVQATYVDPLTGEQSVRNTANGDVVEGASWTCSGDSKTAYVNQDTGVFIAQGAGSIRLTCSVGGAGKLGETMSDSIMVLCGGDTLDKDRNYSPASELKVVVKYASEDKKGIGGESDYETARTWYYSPADLESLGVTENLYTLVKSDGNWATMKARGVYFERLVTDVINVPDFDLSMVKGFYFGSTDAYNPGFVGEGWLFEKARYYYPNMSIGSGRMGAIGVAPMIATATAQEDLVDEPSGDLSPQTRFRLCLGAENTTANNAQQSIYNVHTITVVLNGAPPVGWDDPTAGSGTTSSGAGNAPGGNGSGGTGGSPASGGGQGSGQDTGSDPDKGNAGTNQGPSNPANPSNSGKTGDQQADSQNPADGNTTGETSDANVNSTDQAESRDANANDVAAQGANVKQAEQTVQTQAEAVEQQKTEEQQQKQEEERDTKNDDMFGDAEHRWQVYEMMSNAPALVEALAVDNPLAPFVVPFLLLVCVSGGAASYARFRREVNPLAPAKPPSGLRIAAQAVVQSISSLIP